MKIVYEHSEIQEAIAEHAAKRGFYLDASEVDLADVGDGTVCIEAELVNVSTKKPVPGSVEEKPKQTRKPRTPKPAVETSPVVQPVVKSGGFTKPSVAAKPVPESSISQADLEAHQARLAEQQKGIELPEVVEAPENLTIPKAAAKVPTEAQTAEVVDRMLAEEPEQQVDEVEVDNTAVGASSDKPLPTASELTAGLAPKKPSGFLRARQQNQA